MDDEIRIELDFQQKGANKTRGNLLARRNGEVLHSDVLDLAKHEKVEKYITDLTGQCPGVRADNARREIMGILAKQVRESQGGQIITGEEVDALRIVRPHLFHLPEASGLLTCKSVLVDQRPATRWLLCIQWADGRRECLDLAEGLTLPGGGQLWFEPRPLDLLTGTAPLWTPRGRKAWQQGHTPQPANVFRRLAETFAFYLEFPKEKASGYTATLALWTVLTYVYPIWPAVPYLWVGGPFGSGKTRVFEVLARLVHRPMPSANMTAPLLFRTLHERGGTLLLDEAERLRDRCPEAVEIRSILLSGYRDGSPAWRLEKKGDKFVPQQFQVFGPKAIAGINSLTGALASRCIQIMMFRASPNSPKPKRRLSDGSAKWAELRDDLHALALCCGQRLIDLSGQPDLCDSLGGRDFELWQPMHAIAQLVEEDGAADLVDLVQGHALHCVEENRDEAISGPDETLLRLLAAAVKDGQQAHLTPHSLLEQAREGDQATFRNWRASTVGRTLKRYGIKATPGKQRTYRNITMDQIRQIGVHYGADLGESPENPSLPSSSVIEPATRPLEALD